ncbi:MAG: M3 family metallopeptidase [Prevotellaceae bacterium]|jgi:peptidyl-dipeptidase Dcp|nr:M3 family metallopeptidase [Prevotellaceae bacterium]
MLHKSFIIMSIAAAATAACSGIGNNPFFGEYQTPHEVPPFDKIKAGHYLPAFKEGMKRQAKEVEGIVGNAEEPSFANTIEALELSGEMLGRVQYVFFNLLEAEATPEMDKIAEEITTALSAHRDDILLNEALFARIKSVYGQREQLGLEQEQKRLLENTYKDFVRGGANLSPQSKATLREVNERLSSLRLKFGQNLLSETNSFKLVIENRGDLSGLPQSLVDAAAAAAEEAGEKGKWVFTLKNPSVMPFLQYADSRPLRAKILNAYANRANNGNDRDNNAVAAEMVSLRAQKAALLGYETYADYVLEDCMAKTPQSVYDMLRRLWEPALRKARQEASEQQALIAKGAEPFPLQASDWRYYAEKIKVQSFDLNDEQLRPYFKLENVRSGIFTLVEKLYGVTFTQVTDVPLYHKDVVCFGASDSNGEFLGLIYMDFFPRGGKRGGAWMTDFREQHYRGSERVAPIISLVCNFSPATGDAPSLLTPDEVTTFFHEFGHAIHSLLSNCCYRSLAGTNVPRDFVEMLSQIMENWAFEPELLSLYARHYETDEVIPTDLVNKITAASRYGQGFKTVEYLAASWLDMDYHTLKDTARIDVQQHEQRSMSKIGLIPEILPRYRTTYFNHIFSSSAYEAGYYSYIWSEVLDADAFDQFAKTGNIFDKGVATALRRCILERGDTEDAMELYKRFRGGEPSIEPLLRRRGLE